MLFYRFAFYFDDRGKYIVQVRQLWTYATRLIKISSSRHGFATHQFFHRVVLLLVSSRNFGRGRKAKSENNKKSTILLRIHPLFTARDDQQRGRVIKPRRLDQGLLMTFPLNIKKLVTLYSKKILRINYYCI